VKVLISGGCGFIGCNTAARFSEIGHQVTLYDNLSRVGADSNLDWLRHHREVEFIHGDVRSLGTLCDLLQARHFDVVIHLAAQVAVTTSVTDPEHDFEVNARGTFNVLEAVRRHRPEAVVLNASTNKVYGKLGSLKPREGALRYDLPHLPDGVNEAQPLDFHSPYGCSKGAADQYVNDYARVFGLRTVNLRQSCIYGYRQFGIEDQGWVAWFLIAHCVGRDVTIYGDGKQVRDILFIDDLVDAYLAAIEKIEDVRGSSFNIGGGPANALSLLELLDMIRELSGRPLNHTFSAWRAGDQSVYISDIRLAQRRLGWSPRVSAQEGVRRLYDWITANRDLFLPVAAAKVG
jgi:CDP-paratose 2-epimerase